MTKRLTAYNVFIQKTIPEVRAANPGIKPKDAMKMAASKWSKKGNGFYLSKKK